MEKGHISSTKFQYPKILEKKKKFKKKFIIWKWKIISDNLKKMIIKKNNDKIYNFEKNQIK